MIETLLVLSILASVTLLPVGPRPVNASSSTNMITNPSFELGLTGWGLDTCEGVGNATATVDSGRWVEGSQSAKIFVGPVTNTYCVPTNGTRPVGFAQFPQYFPPGLTFNNLTDSPNGFSFWFYLEPYGNTIVGGFEVRILGGESVAELDYLLDPNPYVQYPNYTSAGGEGLRSLLFYGYQPGQWYHFHRNLRADWAALNLNMTRRFSFVQFQGIAVNNGGIMQSETLWLDDVRVYTGTDPPPSETHYALFDFTDANGNSVDNTIKWKLYNSSGQEVFYTLGQKTLQPGPYFVEAYYRAYAQTDRILREQIHLDTAVSIPLSLFSTDFVPGGHIALDGPVTNLRASQPYSTLLIVNVEASTGIPYSMLVDLPTRPALIQTNGSDLAEGSDWTYDATLSAARIRFTLQAGDENFSIFLASPQRIPHVSFVDLEGSSVQNRITFLILDSRGSPLPYTEGKTLPPGSFFLEAYYGGYRIYRSPLGTIGSPPITLEMIPLDSSSHNYLAVNSTSTTGITPLEFSGSRIQFMIEGPGPYLIVLNAPKRPLYVEKDGLRTPNWVYNSTSQSIKIETDAQGSFLIVLEDTTSYSYPSIFAVVIGITLVTIISLVLWRRKTRLRQL